MQATYDLSAAYHHVNINEEHKKYLCFMVPDKEGEAHYYQFQVMPFGLSSATQGLARITKPICAHLASHGIRHSLYIDDGKINATKDKIVQHLEYTLKVLQQAGFVVAPQKTDTADTVSTTKTYLEFEIDSENMTIRAGPDKLQAIRLVLQAIEQEKGSVKPKLLAKFIGKAISLQPALGPVVQLLTRIAQIELAIQVDEQGWKKKMGVSQETRQGMSELVDRLEEMNGQPIQNLANATSLETVLGPATQTNRHTFYGDVKAKNVVAGDASNKAICAYSVKGLQRFFYQDSLTAEESRLSSGHRELLTVLGTLQAKQEVFLQMPRGSRSVLWLTDSTNMMTFLTKGSTKRDIQEDILKCYDICKTIGLTLTPIHLSREDYRIQTADEGTRFFDPDDWSINEIMYKKLTNNAAPTVDLFAHPNNAKCERFYSYGKCPRSAGIDAFTKSWEGERAWCCPPTSSVISSIKKILATRMEAIVIVPA